jgi:hypothetical protein
MSILNSFATEAARQTLNRVYLKPYGALTELVIDARNKSACLKLELHGESQPLEIRLNRYQLIERGDQTFLDLGEIITSRAWLDTLLREHLLEKVIKPRLAQTPVPALLKLLL